MISQVYKDLGNREVVVTPPEAIVEFPQPGFVVTHYDHGCGCGAGSWFDIPPMFASEAREALEEYCAAAKAAIEGAEKLQKGEKSGV